MYFKEGTTIKDLLVNPNDRDNILQKSEVIYRYKCGRMDCEGKYIEESGRIFAERFKENMKASSPNHDYYNTTGHALSIDNFSIVGSKDQKHCQKGQRSHCNQSQWPILENKHRDIQTATTYETRCWWINLKSSLNKQPHNILTLVTHHLSSEPPKQIQPHNILFPNDTCVTNMVVLNTELHLSLITTTSIIGNSICQQKHGSAMS